jgi:hypothetical protein
LAHWQIAEVAQSPKIDNNMLYRLSAEVVDFAEVAQSPKIDNNPLYRLSAEVVDFAEVAQSIEH